MTSKRLVALTALTVLLLPVIAFLGRERPVGCSPPTLPTPCDPGMSNPEWAMWAFWALVLTALVLAVAAAVRARLLTLTWGVIVGLLIALELIYGGSGYLLSARQSQDRAGLSRLSWCRSWPAYGSSPWPSVGGHWIASPAHRESRRNPKAPAASRWMTSSRVSSGRLLTMPRCPCCRTWPHMPAGWQAHRSGQASAAPAPATCSQGRTRHHPERRSRPPRRIHP
jgi:hypothetical protein